MTVEGIAMPNPMMDPMFLCSAKNARGEPCGLTRVKGAAVCHRHGGKSPQVVRKAKLRLMELVDPAVTTIASVMVDRTARPSDRLRAANSVLDRAGVVRQTENDAEASRALLLERLIAAAIPAPAEQVGLAAYAETELVVEGEVPYYDPSSSEDDDDEDEDDRDDW